MRRIAAARALLEEAAELSSERAIEHAELKALLKVVLEMHSTEVLFALEAVQEAAMAADSGVFGTRPDDEPLRNSIVTAQWHETREAVVGATNMSLMRAATKNLGQARRGLSVRAAGASNREPVHSAAPRGGFLLWGRSPAVP